MELHHDKVIDSTIRYVKQMLQSAEAGHDWFHTERVWKNARLLLKEEQADQLVVEVAALLHDISDSKFNGGDDEIGPQLAYTFLIEQGVDETTAEHVRNIIRFMSFRSQFEEETFSSKEMKIVQDADRLDAIGAIGIARAFQYGGFKNREIYNPAIPPVTFENKEAYKNSVSPSINHFYEKLLLLKDTMYTPTAQKIAQERHAFMENYLEQFFGEWNGEK